MAVITLWHTVFFDKPQIRISGQLANMVDFRGWFEVSGIRWRLLSLPCWIGPGTEGMALEKPKPEPAPIAVIAALRRRATLPLPHCSMMGTWPTMREFRTSWRGAGMKDCRIAQLPIP